MSDQTEFDFEKKREAASAQVIDRIKKLLRLAADKSNRHESELALQRAFELARKFDVDVESLDLDERTAKITHEYFKFSKRKSHLEYLALGVAMTFFRVHCVGGYGRVLFVGLPTDIAIAHYVYEFIVRVGKRELRQFEISERRARRKMSSDKRKQFVSGFVYAMSRQLRETEVELHIDDTKNALIVAEEKAREDYSKNISGPTVPVLLDAKRKNETALMKGWHAGMDNKINKPLGDQSGSPLALNA